MAWAKLDDKFHGNPKILQADLAAIGLYALGLSYCADQLSDGFVPENLVKAWRNLGSFSAKTLVKVGLWSVESGGYRVHDYLQWNPSRVQVLRERSEAAERKRAVRERDASGRTDDGRPAGRQAPTPRHATLTPGVTKVTPGAPPNPPRKRRGRDSSEVQFEEDGPRYEQREDADGKREWVEVEADA